MSPFNQEGHYVTIQDKHTPGTGEWLLKSKVFQEWYNGQGSQVLCCTGEPGVGKTYLLYVSLR